jgi:hypothetical protein
MPISALVALRSGAAPHLGCSQHAPNEHLPLGVAREGLRMMAGVYWDLGEAGVPASTGASAQA